MIIAITGHKPERIKGKEKDIELWLEGQFKNFKACYKDVTLLTGMSRGVDQMAALIAIKNGIKVICYFAYPRTLDKTEQYIVNNAIDVIYFSKEYENRGTYLKRDQALVEKSDVLLVVFDGNPVGGTFYTYSYGVSLNKSIFVFPGFKKEENEYKILDK